VIRQLLRAVEWRPMLIPLGAGLLSAGVQHLEQRRDGVRAELGDLETLVAFRRDQLDGHRPITDEPEPAPGEPAARTWPPLLALALALGLGVGLLGVAARLLGPSPLDDLDDDEQVDHEQGDPWQHAQPIGEHVAYPTHFPGDGCSPEHKFAKDQLSVQTVRRLRPVKSRTLGR
jgi:hypothetical protein